MVVTLNSMPSAEKRPLRLLSKLRRTRTRAVEKHSFQPAGFHIAIDGHRLICEPNTSGSTYLEGLLSVWSSAERPPRITLFLPFLPQPLPKSILSAPGVELLTPDAPHDPLAAFRYQIHWQAIAIPRLLQKCTPNVYFSPFHLTPQWPWRLPVVTTIHDLCFLFEPFISTGSLVHRAQLLSACVRARRLICVSQFTFNMLSSTMPRAAKRATLVTNGTNRKFMAEGDAVAQLRPLDLDASGYFLWIGSPSPRKNPKVLLDAFARYHQKYPGKQFVIVAPAESHLHLWEMSRSREFESSLHLLSSVNDITRDALYRCALALVFPSRCEGFGFPVLEACAQGCPTVAYFQSPAREIVANTLPLAEDFAVDHFVALMRHHAALSLEMRSALSKKLRARAAIFSLERMAAETLTVLREAAGAA